MLGLPTVPTEFVLILTVATDNRRKPASLGKMVLGLDGDVSCTNPMGSMSLCRTSVGWIEPKTPCTVDPLADVEYGRACNRALSLPAGPVRLAKPGRPPLSCTSVQPYNLANSTRTPTVQQKQLPGTNTGGPQTPNGCRPTNPTELCARAWGAARSPQKCTEGLGLQPAGSIVLGMSTHCMLGTGHPSSHFPSINLEARATGPYTMHVHSVLANVNTPC